MGLGHRRFAPARTAAVVVLTVVCFQRGAGGEPVRLRFTMVPGGHQLEQCFDLERAFGCELRVSGLTQGGAVLASLDGAPVEGELMAETADALAAELYVAAELAAGTHRLVVREVPGVQFARVKGTAIYVGGGTGTGPHPVFRLDVDRRGEMYPVEIYFGPDPEPFFLLSGKWDCYPGESYTDEVRDLRTTSGTETATLSLCYVHRQRQLVMPTDFVLHHDGDTGNAILRIVQILEAEGSTSWTDTQNVEFLHVDLTPRVGRDWCDGGPDYFWNREQVDIDNDTLPGAHTHVTRVENNGKRVFTYRTSTVDPDLTATTSPNHTSFAHPLYAENTVGGWFTKHGTGSIGWIMHRYTSSFNRDMTPIHSHCGAGADTHIYSGWHRLHFPWSLQSGDRIRAEYTLQCMPSEVRREDIEMINEYDLLFFGEEGDATSAIVRWYGTTDACGLLRSDGSATILGLSPGRTFYEIPDAARGHVQSVFRIRELSPYNWIEDAAEDGRAIVRGGWITIVDCGSALDSPAKRIHWPERLRRRFYLLFSDP